MNLGNRKLQVALGAILVLGALLLIFGLAGCASRPASGPTGTTGQADYVYIYIPCGMREPFDHALKMFNQKYPGLEVKAYYDNAVVLVQKIKDGDRPDLFVSPGEIEMRELVQQGIIDVSTVTNIGTYNLALVVPASNPAGIKTLEDLAKPSVKSIAIAEPLHNSVGYYAMQTLSYYKLLGKVKNKLVNPEHALDVVTFAVMKKVDAALAYETCPLQSAPEKASKESVKILMRIPDQSHFPILAQIGLLGNTPHITRAQQFMQFLTSAEVQKVFQETGLPSLSNLKDIKLSK